MHDDSCVGDNWSNYHQRLNRRYDSGYKSIENQLSSSLEGNAANFAGIQARSPTPGGACAQQQQQPPHPTGAANNSGSFDPSLLARPQSGCSGTIWRPTSQQQPAPQPIGASSASELTTGQQGQQNVAEKMDSDFAKFTATIVETDEEFSYQQEQELDEGSSIDDTIDGKLAELELEDTALECLLGDPNDRECQSRGSSSKSSNEGDSKIKGQLQDGSSPNNS